MLRQEEEEDDHGLTPLIFEALMFLKVKIRFWDLNLVVNAMHLRRTEAMEQVLAEDAEQLAMDD
jgi:hypothetical protein